MYKTAWDLCGDWQWIADGKQARIKGGHIVYDQADATRSGRVKLSRLNHDLRQITRYVDVDTPIEFV